MTNIHKESENRLFPTPLPPASLVTSVMKTSAYEDALRDTADIYKIHDTTESTLFFGLGIKDNPLTFSRLDGGAIKCSEQGFRLRQPKDPKNDEFQNIWKLAKTVAYSKLTKQISSHLGLGDFSVLNYDYDKHPEVTTELKRTVSGVRAKMGIGYGINPSRLMRHILNKFLDKKTLNLAIRYGGSTATIDTYNAAALYPNTLRSAYDINPNALVVWMGDRTRALHSLQQGITPDEIIEDVKIEKKDDFDLITNLSPKLIREIHPDTRNFCALLKTLEKMGTIPTYSICRVILKYNYPYFPDHGYPVMREIFRLSHLSPKQRGFSQKELARQAKAVIGELISLSKKNTAECGFTDDSEHKPDWNKLAANVLATQKERAQTKPKKTRATSRSKFNERLPTFDEFAERLDEQTLARINSLIATDQPVQIDPGKSVRLTAHNQTESFLEMTKTPTGFIRTNPEYVDYRNIASADSPDEPPTYRQWTSMGFGKTALATVITAAVSESWDLRDGRTTVSPPQPRSIVMWTDRISHLLVGTDKYDDALITERVRSGVRSLVNPETLNRTIKIFGPHPKVWEYNNISMDHSPIRDLAKTNPIVAVWLSQDHQAFRQITDFNHPGEFVSATRSRMKSMGFDLRDWKAVNRLPIKTIKKALDARSSTIERIFIILQATAHAGHLPHDWVLNQTTSFNRALKEHPSENLKKTLRLMIDESVRINVQDPDDSQDQLRSDYLSTLDYTNNMDDTESRIMSKTWSGLMKKCERWHRQQNANSYKHIFTDVLSRNDNKYREWNSLIETMNINGHRVSPLTSDLKLFHETVEMSHCVAGYGGQCVRGYSRIFAIYKGDKHAATGQIQLSDDQWTTTQTQGPHNHHPGPESHRTMETLADIYTERWRNTPQEERNTVAMIPFEGDPIYKKAVESDAIPIG